MGLLRVRLRGWYRGDVVLMARTGRPTLPAHLRKKPVERRDLDVYTFFNFCTRQEQRLRRSLTGYADDTRVEGDDLTHAYRTERLGPALHAKEDLIEMKVRR